jgi:hypothetical protein
VALSKGQFGAMKAKDASHFTGIVGRQSEKVSGKQGRHHHPLVGQLGAGMAGGMPMTGRMGAYRPPKAPAMARSKK